MNERVRTISLKINGTPLDVPKGLTILEAARRNGIYIPALCSFEGLEPYGGCRMCIVEVEGLRGYTTACTMPAADGMVVRTYTDDIRLMQTEILQLILSEHTSSCLICDERDTCKESMHSIRKAGVTTGCRYCPNDSQCDLQDVVEHMGITELVYPVYYRNLRVEKEDPFYDRDYNLCILCGRCIRVCREVRSAGVLTFKQRGRNSVIGPAFDRTHLESGCEFCGACVSVCPTGALAEKARKWDGKAERETLSTCALCGVGCQLRLLIKGDKVIGSLPADDSIVNNGQLCVKGRFCITELVNSHHRLASPAVILHGGALKISWPDAITLAVAKLSACPPDRFGMLISSDCTNEDQYIAQKFTRVVMGSHNIDTLARVFYGDAFNAYIDCMKEAVPLSRVKAASTILCVGLDTQYGRSVVGVALREAARTGAKIISIHPNNHSLSLLADVWLRPEPGEEVSLLGSLEKATQKGKKGPARAASKGKGAGNIGGLAAVAALLEEATSLVILLGSHFFGSGSARLVLETIVKLARNIGAGIIPLPAQGNLIGSILMGAYPEFLPGGFPSNDRKRLSDIGKKWGAKLPPPSSPWNAGKLRSRKKLSVLYLVGVVPTVSRPPADFVIFQNIYPPDPFFEADLMFPAVAFTETDGTLINGGGRVQRVRRAVDPPGEALPDWKILCSLARRMDRGGFDFSSAAAIRKEFSALVPERLDLTKGGRKPRPLEFEGTFAVSKGLRPPPEDGEFHLLNNLLSNEHRYRGFPIADWVEGARELFPWTRPFPRREKEENV